MVTEELVGCWRLTEAVGVEQTFNPIFLIVRFLELLENIVAVPVEKLGHCCCFAVCHICV